MALSQIEGRPQFGSSAGASAGSAQGGNILSLIIPAATAIASAFRGSNNGTSQTDTTTPNLSYPLDPRPQNNQSTLSPWAQRHLGFESPYDTATAVDQTYGSEQIAAGNPRVNFLPDWLGNRHYMESAGYDSSAGSGLSDFQSGYADLLRQLMEGYNQPGHGISIPGGSIHASQATAKHASATHAVASLIDMLDKAYNERPDADLREDIYGRLSEGARASARNEIRGINDAARLSGAGPNAPWAQALSAEANRNASRTATQGLTDFYDRYVEAAFARRHGAMSTNAELATGVNKFNAAADNEVSIFNAGADNTVSQFNAGARNWAAGANANLNQQAAELRASIGRQQLSDILRMSEFALTPQTGGGSTTTRTVNGQDPDWLAGVVELARAAAERYRTRPPRTDTPGGGGDTSGGVLDNEL